MKKRAISFLLSACLLIGLLPVFSVSAAATDFTDTITASGTWSKTLNTIFEGESAAFDGVNISCKNLTVSNGGDASSAAVYFDGGSSAYNHISMGFSGEGTTCDGFETLTFSAAVAGTYSFEVFSENDITKTVQITVTGSAGAQPEAITVGSVSGGWIEENENIFGLNHDHTKAAGATSVVRFNGEWYAAWNEGDFGSTKIRVAKRSASDSTWSFIDGDGDAGINRNTAQNAVFPKLAVYNGSLYAAWIEQTTLSISGTPKVDQIFVAKYSGTPGSWTAVDAVDSYGATALNMSDYATYGYPAVGSGALSIAADSSGLYVAWAARPSSSDGNNRLFVSKYNGTGWTAIGGTSAAAGLNVSNAANVLMLSLTCGSTPGTLYAAWQESGHIYAKYYNGSTWSSLGGALEYKAQGGYSFSSMGTAVLGGVPYVAWSEMNDNSVGQIRISKYVNGAWLSIDGGSSSTGLNHDTSKSGNYVSLAADSDHIYLGWQEASSVATQVRLMSYNPTDSWKAMDVDGIRSGGDAVGLNMDAVVSTTGAPAIGVGDGKLCAAFIECANPVYQLQFKEYDSTFTLPSNGDQLSKITTSTGELYPAVGADTYNYTILVDKDTTDVSFTLTLADPSPDAFLVVGSTIYQSGQTFTMNNLNVGDNYYTPILLVSHKASVIHHISIRVNRAVSATQRKIGPSADSCYDNSGSSYPNESTNRIGADVDANHYTTVMKFDYGFLTDEIIASSLNFKIESVGDDDDGADPYLNLYGSNDTTWTAFSPTIPTQDKTIVTNDSTDLTAGTEKTYDVFDAYVKSAAAKTAVFVLTGASSDGTHNCYVSLHSMEAAGAADWPYLLITTKPPVPTISVTATGSAGSTYGSADSRSFSIADSNFTTVPTAYTPEWCKADGTTANAPSAGTLSVGTVTDGDATLTLTPSATADAGTYYFKVSSGDTSAVTAFTIAKAAASNAMKTAAATVPSSGKTGATATLPALPAGASCGIPAAGEAITMTGMSISGTTLTFNAPASTAGQIGTITIPVSGAKNYNEYSITVTITSVAKTEVTISGLAAADGTYSGSAVAGYSGTPAGYAGTLSYTYYLADGTTKTTAGNSGAASDGAAPVNAGSYRLTASVPESDETYTGSASVDFTVAKAPVSFTVSGSTYSYDAAAHTATVAQTASETPSAAGKFNVTYQKNTETAAASEINVGQYKIIVTLTDDNLKFFGQTDAVRSLTLTDKLTINAAEYTGITWPAAGGLTYGQTLSASTLTGGAGAGTFAWKTGTTVPTVGNSGCPVVFTPTDANYAAVEHTALVTVSPKELTVTGAAAASRAYDGTKTVAVTGGTLQGVVGSDDVTLISANASGTVASADAGSGKAVTVAGYTLSGTAAGNYTLTQPTGLTAAITQADGTASVTMTGWTYGGTASEPVPASATNGTTGVTYSYAGRSGTSYSAGTARPAAPGDYTVTAVFPAGTNYKSTTAAADFTIAKRPVTATWTDTTRIYTGEPQKPTLALTGTVDGDTLTVSCGTQTSAGTYTLTAALDGADKGSYTLANGSSSFTIQKAPVSFTVADNSKAYTGSPLYAAVTASANGAKFTAFTVTYQNSRGETAASPTDAGSYDVYAAIADTNYRIANSADGTARKIGVLTIYTTPPATYTVGFSGGEGATGTAPTMDAAVGGTVRTLPANTFTKTNFVFAGWKYDGKIYQAGDAFTQPAASVTFTAQWTAVYDIGGTVTQKQEADDPLAIQGAAVVLKRGSGIAAATTTDKDGNYNFEGAANSIVPGLYNIEVSYGGIVQTTAVTITDSSVTANVVLPVGKTNTVVDVKAGTPPMVVDGLTGSFTEAKADSNYTPDDAAVVTAGGSVEIKFNAETTEPDNTTTVASSGKTVKATIDAALGKVGLYLDLNIEKTVLDKDGNKDNGKSGAITSSSDLYTATIWLPGELQGMYSYKTVRMHDYGSGAVLDTLTTAPNTYGEYFEVSADKTRLTLHVRYFSDYAIGYTATAPATPGGTTGGATGGSGTSAYSVTAPSASNGTVKLSAASAASGAKITVTVTPDSGYMLGTLTVKDSGGNTISCAAGSGGTYTFTMPASAVTVSAVFSRIPASPEATGVSGLLQTVDHIRYISGYADGTVGPERNMTRGEAAQMFYNLLLDQSAAESVKFSDVPDTLWCARAVRKLSALGVIKGYASGAFGVNDPVTREQFCAMAVRFATKIRTGSVDYTTTFSDVKAGTWSYDSVMTAAALGWIGGYAGGSFGPRDSVTRAQVVTIVNRMLGRAADKNFVDSSAGVRTFSDLSKSHWAYYDLMEAANAHDYKTSSGSETWSALK